MILHITVWSILAILCSAFIVALNTIPKSVEHKEAYDAFIKKCRVEFDDETSTNKSIVDKYTKWLIGFCIIVALVISCLIELIQLAF